MDFAIGQIAERSITLTEEHVEKYADLTGDRNPLQTEYFKRPEHARRCGARIDAGQHHGLLSMSHLTG